MADTDRTHSRNHRVSLLVQCMITTLILLFIALTAASTLSWLILHPRLPKFHMESLSVSNLTLSNDTKIIFADYTLAFTVKNPNWKINMWFYCLDVSIEHKKCKLASKRVGHFPLWKMNQTEKKLKLETNASNRAVGEIHEEELMSKKEVIFDVKMRGWATVRCGKWMSKNRLVEVECEKLRMVFSSSDPNYDKVIVTGKLIDGGADCSVSWLPYS